jgi:tetratricopeptide (TPR) repeat protein
MGDFARALATLNEFATGEEPPFGMMFNYHRGWILNLMGRHEEALRKLDEGLETQPDYGGAFEQRACAYARLGRLEEALADHRQADELNAAFFGDALVTPAVAHDRAWARSVNAAFEAAIAAGNTGPIAAPCEGAWKHGEVKRTRSRLLPKAAADSSSAIDAI